MHKFVVLYNQPRTGSLPQLLREHAHPARGGAAGPEGLPVLFSVASPGQDDPPYFCIFEGDFEDAASMGEAMSGEYGQKVGPTFPTTPTGGRDDPHLRGGGLGLISVGSGAAEDSAARTVSPSPRSTLSSPAPRPGRRSRARQHRTYRRARSVGSVTPR